MFSRLHHRAQREEGFTLIELLVVILIIGILAAIAIPNFLGQTRKAQDASAKSDARNAVSAMESCFTDTQSYATCNNTTLSTGGMQVTTGTEKGKVKANSNGTSSASNATTYSVTAYSRSSLNTSFTVTNTGGAFQYSCTPVGGGCPSDGNWDN